MKIYFSNNDILKSFNYFLESVDLGRPNELIIKTRSNWLNIHPAALVFSAALASVCGKENTIIDNTAGDSGLYLDRMGLYNYSKTASPYSYQSHDPAGRFIPISRIKTQEDQSRFVSDLAPLLHLDQDKSQTIRYVVGELVRNVLEHSESEDGAFVAAQYRAKSNVISLGVCDNGIGLRNSLAYFYHPNDDSEAIRLALAPGVSGTTNRGVTENNAGAGLFIVKNLSRITRSHFVIYSGKSLYKLLLYDKRTNKPRINANAFDDKHSLYENLPDFHGTLVGIDISLDDTNDFNEQMEYIKQSFTKALNDRRKINYRRVKFL